MILAHSVTQVCVTFLVIRTSFWAVSAGYSAPSFGLTQPPTAKRVGLDWSSGAGPMDLANSSRPLSRASATRLGREAIAHRSPPHITNLCVLPRLSGIVPHKPKRRT
jgi:hypothetical protein